MQIDRMRLQDLEQVGVLSGQLGYPDAASGLKSRFQEIENHGDYGLFVARDKDGAVTGWVQVNLEPVALLTPARADVAALIVDQNRRGQNIGKRLLERAELWAREKNVALLRLRSGVHRVDAHRFYIREGYTLAKTSHVFTKLKGARSDSAL